MKKHALIVWGGWDGHEPSNIAALCDEILTAEGLKVTVCDSLDAFLDEGLMASVDLIVPIWTMGEITHDQCMAVVRAVSERGVGLAGSHGGMCDAFRSNTEWQFMTGGQWVAHPGDTNVSYTVNIQDQTHPITAGIEDFQVTSEQYYLHTDPGNCVLATTDFPSPGFDGPHSENPCRMPQVWTKKFGNGRVFYIAIGHRRSDLETGSARELLRRGSLWACDLLN